MTEQMAIIELQHNIDLPFGGSVSDEASEMAIKALEEIQQYRALGTVEELTEAMNLYVAINKIEDDMCLLGVPSRAEAREHIKAMARQMKGKV